MRVVPLTKGEDVLPVLKGAVEAGDAFDICISDIQMPGVTGYDIVKQIRAHNMPIRSLPLLALSSSLEIEAKICCEAGFDGFLPKPVHRKRLLEMMERLLGESGKSPAGIKNERILTRHSLREESKHAVRILLAEDNPVNQKLIMVMLLKGGYHVETTNNGREAFERFTNAPDAFDLILMDIQMPDMDGIEAAQEIRKLEEKLSPGRERIPIIAVTANAMKGDMENYIEAGMDDYLPKPIKREAVFEMIKKWVLDG